MGFGVSRVGAWSNRRELLVFLTFCRLGNKGVGMRCASLFVQAMRGVNFAAIAWEIIFGACRYASLCHERETDGRAQQPPICNHHLPHTQHTHNHYISYRTQVLLRALPIRHRSLGQQAAGTHLFLPHSHEPLQPTQASVGLRGWLRATCAN
jgi:hypothetical protein